MSLFVELKRRNVFKVAAAYIIIGWLTMQAGETLAPALHLPEWVNSLLAFFLLLGFPLALFFSWVFELTPEGIKKEKEIDRSQSVTHVTGQRLNYVIIILMATALAYFTWDKFVSKQEELAQTSAVAEDIAAKDETVQQGPDEKSIAVLPFVNMSDDASNEYFSDGITEEVLNLLARIPELRVTSRSSVFSFKGQNVDIPTVAKKLNVAHILEGSVRKAGNRVRITAQLIKANSDVHIWSETYDRELDDIFAIQDEIAAKVVTVLQVKLLNRTLVSSETNSEAYTAYLQGRHQLETGSKNNATAAQKAFELAIEIDPEYAPAWAGLSQALRHRANYGDLDLHEGTEQARQAVLKALTLDETLAEAWANLSRIQYVYDWDWSAAWGTSQTALMHGPNNVDALGAAADVAEAIGRLEDARKFSLKAVEVDPLNLRMLRGLGTYYFRTENFDEAEVVFQKILEIHPGYEFVQSWLALTKAVQGKPEEASHINMLESDKDMRILIGAYITHDLGDTRRADEYLNYHIANSDDWLAYQIAELFAYRGDIEKAFEWLEITYEQRDGGVSHLLTDATFISLHDDPRWEPYLLKVGLLDYWKDLQEKRGESDP